MASHRDSSPDHECSSAFQAGFSRCLERVGLYPSVRSYSPEFEAALRRYFGDHMSHRKIAQWWDDHMGARTVHALQVFLPWAQRAVDLNGKVVLEVGCGTGSSTVALAAVARHVIAV